MHAPPIINNMLTCLVEILLAGLTNVAKSKFEFKDWVCIATAEGRLHHLHSWWTQLLSRGPEYGYHSKASKTWLVVKQEYSLATELFADSGVQTTVEGRRHLGTALGTRYFTEA